MSFMRASTASKGSLLISKGDVDVAGDDRFSVMPTEAPQSFERAELTSSAPALIGVN